MRIYFFILIMVSALGCSWSWGQNSSIQLTSQTIGPFNLLWANKPYSGLTVGADYLFQCDVDVSTVGVNLNMGGITTTAPTDGTYQIMFTASATTHDLNVFAFTLFTPPFSVELDNLELLEVSDSTFMAYLFEYRNGYRYAFNGMEKDDEIKEGIGNSYDFGARMYDSRLGRWLSLDPQATTYPDQSPYHFGGNSPVIFYDPDGKKIIIHYTDASGNAKQYTYTPGVKPTTSDAFVNQVHEAISYSIQTQTGKDIYGDLHQSKHTINIKLSSNDNMPGALTDFKAATSDGDKITQDGIEATIVWNPSIASVTVDDQGNATGAHAPSTILLHEGGHAQKLITHTSKKKMATWLKGAAGKDGTKWDNAEEKRNITGPETNYVTEINAIEDTKEPTVDYQYKDEDMGGSMWKTTTITKTTSHTQRQGTRTNHSSGGLYKSTGVNSTAPQNKKMQIKGAIGDYYDVQESLPMYRPPVENTAPRGVSIPIELQRR